MLAFYNLFLFLDENPFRTGENKRQVLCGKKNQILQIQDSCKHVMNFLQIKNGPKSDIESFLASWMLNDKSKNEAFLEALKCDIVLRDSQFPGLFFSHNQLSHILLTTSQQTVMNSETDILFSNIFFEQDGNYSFLVKLQIDQYASSTVRTPS